jgi:D-glycero-alpha-D-manno-heptose-7-phosphate kinase
MGGTLDISTFYYPLAYVKPVTVNIALDLRTRVRLLPHDKGYVQVSSKGFDSAQYPLDALPFDHPMGLIFLIAAHFHLDGIHIHIESESPPRSALGGSSVASVVLVGAYLRLLERLGGPPGSRRKTALLAHAMESVTAGVPCGLQDQLAAVYGGVNAWHWSETVETGDERKCQTGEGFRKEALVDQHQYSVLDKSILLAYCGIPHESKDVNQKWVRQFLSGESRTQWMEIAECSRSFGKALQAFDFDALAHWMNREVDIRCRLTPEVLDRTGKSLVTAAREKKCGARFCGAGGGGCIWAVGEPDRIANLSDAWYTILSATQDGEILHAPIAGKGLCFRGRSPLATNQPSEKQES